MRAVPVDIDPAAMKATKSAFDKSLFKITSIKLFLTLTLREGR